VVVATGSTPFFPDVPGLKESLPWTNRQGTGAKSVPRRLLVLGGGPVGVELSQVWKSLGSAEVTLITQRMLARQEPFVGELIAQALRNSGVEVRLNTRLKQVRRTDKEVFATLDSGQTLAADEILVATGRLPASNDLGLETIGLEPGHPIEVDDSLRATRVPDGWLYACGDVNGRNLLTHMGKYQARLAGDAVLGKKVSAWADHTATPQVIFTQPQVASAGLTHEKAVQKGLRVRVVRHALEDVAGLSVQGPYWRGVAQLVVDEDRRIIVGATFVGPGVGEMIHAATIAIAGEVPLERLWHAVPSFPTVGEVWLHLLQAYGV
jgi:dihydrolipoamide dehydrogenase